MAKKACDDCEEKTERKHLGKIRGKSLCKKCRKKVRERRRNETINKAGIEEDLELLDVEIRKTSQKKACMKRNQAKKIKAIIDEAPIPKGSIRGKVKQKNKSESYLGFQESQLLLRILMRRGLDFEEAKESVEEIKNQLKETRYKMKVKNKSEDEIKIKQQQLLEELYNS